VSFIVLHVVTIVITVNYAFLYATNPKPNQTLTLKVHLVA